MVNLIRVLLTFDSLSTEPVASLPSQTSGTQKRTQEKVQIRMNEPRGKELQTVTLCQPH